MTLNWHSRARGTGAAVTLLLAAWTGGGPACAAQLALVEPVLTIAPGGYFTLDVHLDMNELMPGRQAPTNGLYSFGAKVLFDTRGLSVSSTNDITIPPELDGNGLFGPAQRTLGSGSAGAAGAVAFTATNGYAGTKVMSVRFNVLTAGVHKVRIAFFHDPPVANFVDFGGRTLDAQITNFSPCVVWSGVRGPRIQTLRRTGSNTVRVVFVNPDFAASSFFLEGAASPTQVTWQVDGAARFSAGTNGLYEFECNSPAGRQYLFRIGATP